jgi:Lrp/AsnC family transcriptional regulator for asnA, asnC and gidA
MGLNSEIDNLDLQILSRLMQNAQKPFTEIAQELEVSGGTIHVRMKKMRRLGIVRGSHLDVDPEKLGFDVCAFVGVFLEKGSFYNRIVRQILEIPEVVEVHYTTGRYSIFLKIVCRNTRNLRQVLNDKVQPIEGIQRTETFISLEESTKRNLSFLTGKDSEINA